MLKTLQKPRQQTQFGVRVAEGLPEYGTALINLFQQAGFAPRGEEQQLVDIFNVRFDKEGKDYPLVDGGDNAEKIFEAFFVPGQVNIKLRSQKTIVKKKSLKDIFFVEIRGCKIKEGGTFNLRKAKACIEGVTLVILCDRSTVMEAVKETAQ